MGSFGLIDLVGNTFGYSRVIVYGPDGKIKFPTGGGGGSGTVTSVSVSPGTGISASVATPTTTPVITITNTAPDQVVALTSGTGISIIGTYPNFTITNTLPDQTVVLTAGTGISISGTYPSFTISNTYTDGIPFAVASGTDTYTATISGVTSYADGDAYLIRFTNGNTDAATLNINSLGAIPLHQTNQIPLIGGDIWDGGEMLCIYNATDNSFECVGTSPNSLFAYITNDQGSTITKGQAVYAFSGTGNRMTVKLAKADADSTSAQTIGVVYSTSIAANQKGIIIIQGYLTGLSVFPTATWSDGDPIYLSPTTAGAFTKTKPLAPNHLVYCGVLATASNGSAGRMYVRIQNGYEMDELHDVASTGAVNNDILYRDTTVTPNLWKPASIATILGYTPVATTRTISTTSPLSGGGDLSADRTLSIADAVADGATKGAAAFTAADFNSASGVISIDYTNGQKATASQPGFLTAADWTTFNSKPSTDSIVFASAPNSGHTNTGGTTSYWAITGSGAINATENARVVVMPCAGTLKNFYVRMGAGASSTGSIVMTVRKNAVDTALTVTFTNADGSNVTKSDTTNSVSVSAGDRITVGGTNNATAQAGTVVSITLLLER